MNETYRNELVERFLSYVKIDTQSSEEGEGRCPSTDKQLQLARHLTEELKTLGLEEVEMDQHGYVYATLPANTKRNIPTIGFIAHIDTSPDCSATNVRPRIIEAYDGSDIQLNSEETSSSPTEPPCWAPTTRLASPRLSPP